MKKKPVNKKKSILTAISILLLLTMLTAVCSGCKNGDESKKAQTQTPTATKVTNVYHSEFFSIPENFSPHMESLTVIDDRVYLLCYEVVDRETYQTRAVLYSFDVNGENPQTDILPVPESENSYLQMFSMNPDKSHVSVYVSYDERTETQTYSVIKTDADGNTVYTVEPQEMFTTQSEDSMRYGGFYIQKMASDNMGRAYIATDAAVLVLSETGEKLCELEIAGYLQTMTATEDGKMIINYFDHDLSENTLRSIDADKKTLSDPIKLAINNINQYDVFIGRGYDYYLKDTTGLYGINAADTEPTLLLNWLNSDINPNSVNTLTILSPEQMISSGYNSVSHVQEIIMMTRVPDDEVTPKYVVNLSCLYTDYNLLNYIVNFNRTNNNFRIVVNDYSKYNTPDNWEQGMTVLKNELAAGQVPDILISDSALPMQSYIQKGLFTDLYPYIDSDPTLSRDQLLKCIQGPFEYNGTLPQLVTGFTLHTLAGKTKLIGSAKSWTLEEMLRLADETPEGVSLFEDMTNSDILNTMCRLSLDAFIDPETNQCSFDSEQFIQLLNYANTLGDKNRFQTMSDAERDEYFDDRYKAYRDETVLLYTAYFSSFSEYLQLLFIFDTKDVTLIGYPSTTGNGTAINASTSYLIADKSLVKDGAWEFLSYLLSDECQTGDLWAWPVTYTALDTYAESEMNMEYFFYYNGGWSAGSKPENDSSEDSPSVDVALLPDDGYSRNRNNDGKRFELTSEDVDFMRSILDSITTPSSYDETLMTIIDEEAAIFFNGEKSAEETAKIIQGRASIYINENS